MWEKLEQIARRCAEIGELLTVPEIYGDVNEHGYIVPGLGDAGDRIFGTK